MVVLAAGTARAIQRGGRIAHTMADTAHLFHDTVSRRRIRVRGAVQGVGFRPFVWSLAHECGLNGWVLNDSEGVLAEVEGMAEALDLFEERLLSQAPPLARIDRVEDARIEPQGETGFGIRASHAGAAARTMVTADMATCEACLEDMFTPGNPRHLYAFTNCTHCGPRYTITRRLPYDRAETSMAPFEMCPTCQSAYDDPADRRFHAQPNACPECGPQLSMTPAEIVQRLTAGQILAIKGLGGFHLAVDAHNAAAVARLRQRKGRDGKPFAVMVPGLASARRWADISHQEAGILTDRRRPVVICRTKPNRSLAPGVSNGLPTVGLMLPYAPVHHLILHALCGAPDGIEWMAAPQAAAIVMTSANPGGEPLVTDNQDAVDRLGHIADAILTHDRDIVVRCDDSVVRVIDGAPTYLRRARGFVPDPVELPQELPPTLAVGGHLKDTICVIRGREAFLSQHLGDLDNAATLTFLKETTAHLLDILAVRPDRVACDLHPDFLSTRYAEETGLPLVRVQHHQAHIAAVMAEHGLDERHLGLALDGFGLGDDGQSSWGGELLSAGANDFDRVGHLSQLAQPGGDAAARAPWRMAAAALHAMGRTDEIPQRFADRDGADLVAAMLERGLNAPLTSSAGRLFDAACGLLGVRDTASFEGEAPMALEGLVTKPAVLPSGWTIGDDGTLDLMPLLEALLDRSPEDGANVFHGTLAAALADWAANSQARPGTPSAILASGGCFQNAALTECLKRELVARGLDLLTPVRAPANDGGLSLGQAWVAAHTPDHLLEG